MNLKSYLIDEYHVEIFSIDKKGKRTRWGDKVISLYSEGRHIGEAVFASEGERPPEPYFSEGIIYYFAPCTQFQVIYDLLNDIHPVYIAWRPVHDPRESDDGDAVFYTDNVKR